MSEQLTNIEYGKTAGLLSFHCMTKEFRNCKIDVEAYDARGNKVFTEKNAESGTYKVKYNVTGEYKISFFNKEVAEVQAENRETDIGRPRVLLLRKSR